MKNTVWTAIVIILIGLVALGVHAGSFLSKGMEPFGYLLIAFLVFAMVIAFWLNSYARQNPGTKAH